MIIGLHGRMGSGKNAAAKRLAIIQDTVEVVEVSFARKLKESVAALFDISLEDIEAWKNDDRVYAEVGFDGGDTRGLAMSFRAFLQRFGVEAHRDVFGQDFWLDAALPLDKDYSGKLYVVTDMRFSNEIQRVRELGGYTVQMVGPDYDAGHPAAHSSEEQSECDYVVHNTVRDDNFLRLDMALAGVLASIYGSEFQSEWLRTA